MWLLRQFCIGIIAILLCLPSVVTAQLEEGQEFDAVQYRSTPEVQGFSALCRAMYWYHMGKQSHDDKTRVKSYQNAKEQLSMAIKFDPESSFLYTKLVEVFIDLKDVGKAISACKKALELNPDNVEAHYWFGRLKFATRDRQGAIREFKIAAELMPEHLGTQSILAAILYEDMDYAGAAKAFSEVVKVMPYTYDHRLRNKLGYSYMMTGKIDEAIKEFNAAARLRSNYLEPHFHLAFLYARQSRNKEAIKECMIVLGSSPSDDTSIILLLSEIHVAMNNFDMAIPLLDDLLKRRGLKKDILAEANYRLGTAHKGKKEISLANRYFRKAISLYKEILKNDSENIDIHYYLAMAYDSKGDASLAEWHLREYIKLRPDEPNAYNYLGYMLLQNDSDLEEALKFIKKAVEKEPKNGAFRDSLGWAYYKLGSLDDAITELEMATELIPDDSEVREHLGEVYLKKGGEFAKKAAIQWEKALEIKPGNVDLQLRLEELNKTLE